MSINNVPIFFAASASANNLYEFAVTAFPLFPFLSVGPLPACIITSLNFFALAGIMSVPFKFPVLLLSTFSSAKNCAVLQKYNAVKNIVINKRIFFCKDKSSNKRLCFERIRANVLVNLKLEELVLSTLDKQNFFVSKKPNTFFVIALMHLSCFKKHDYLAPTTVLLYICSLNVFNKLKCFILVYKHI